jgi:hypothetical protein
MGRPRTEHPLVRRRRFIAWMKERFVLRFHMAVILGLTFAAGLLVTKLLLVSGNTNLAVRYAVAVGASYLAFLLLLKGWLRWMDGEPLAPDVDADDVVDAVNEIGSLARDPGPGFHGEGGRFGGGGASSAWGDATGSVLDGDADDALIVVIAIVVVGIALSMLYLVYAAPTILAEVAFEAFLAGSLIRGARRAESGWVGGAVRATIVPFAITMALGIGFGTYAGRACPSALRAVDVLHCAQAGGAR